MLFEECGTFAKDGDDIGCNPNLQMAINLKDDVPVQRAYTSIPKPLQREVKEYLQDLLVKGWIVKSKPLPLFMSKRRMVHSDFA